MGSAGYRYTPWPEWRRKAASEKAKKQWALRRAASFGCWGCIAKGVCPFKNECPRYLRGFEERHG